MPKGNDMDLGTSLELLATTHQFPGKYVFKAIGVLDDDFPDRIVAAIRSELKHEFDSPASVRETSGRRHVSVTVEPWIETPEQVLAIYDRLKAETGLVMLF